MKGYLLILFTFIFSTFWCNNENIDSLITSAYNESDTTKKAKLLITTGYALINNDNDKAKLLIDEALNLFENITDSSLLINAYQVKGHLETSRANYDIAIKYLLKALQLANKGSDYKQLCKITNSLGNCYVGIDDANEQIKYYNLTIEYAKKSNSIDNLALGYLGYALALENKNEYDSSIYYHKNALKLFKYSKRKDAILACITNITNNYIEQDLQDSAKQYFEEGFNYIEKQNNKYLIAEFHHSYANYLFQKQKYKEALEQISKTLPILTKLDSKNHLIKAKILYAKILLKQHKYKEASKQYELALSLKDSLYSENKLKYIEEMNTKYETYEKELKILSQNQLIVTQKNSILEKDLRHSYDTKIRIYLIIGCLIFILLAFYLYNRFRLISKQKQLIEKQKHQIEEKNNEVTASITYALKIQQAMLPSLQVVNNLFPDNFIFYQPKDIVAGDFYWVEKIGNTSYIAACDCTGHGVPGAMVSVICNNALNSAVKEFKLLTPGDILDKAREIVTFEFQNSDDDIKDGMDIALIAIDHSNNTLQFSGAHNSLYYVRGGELKELKGNKQPVGKYASPIPFLTSNLTLEKGDQLYLTTDGYYDQFGGEKGKKFKSKNFKELLVNNSNESISNQKEKLINSFENWKGDHEQLDDVCVIGIKI